MPAAEVLAVQKQVEGMDAAGVASWLAVRGYSPAEAKVLSLCVSMSMMKCVYTSTQLCIYICTWVTSSTLNPRPQTPNLKP